MVKLRGSVTKFTVVLITGLLVCCIVGLKVSGRGGRGWGVGGGPSDLMMRAGVLFSLGLMVVLLVRFIVGFMLRFIIRYMLRFEIRAIVGYMVVFIVGYMA